MTALVFDLMARSRIALAWWVFGVLAMGGYVVAVYDTLGSVEDLRRLYDQYPESIRSLFGEVDIGTIDGWIHIELLSWIPLVLGVYGGIFAAGTVSREAEQRTIDFILGQPLSRRQFLGSRLFVGSANIIVICVSVLLLLVIGVALTGHSPSAGRYSLSLLNAGLLGCALFTAYVLVASRIDDQARVTGMTIGATLVLYIGTGALNAADAPNWLQWLSPFEHYRSAEIMARGETPFVHLTLLVMGALLGAAAALYSYDRRDL